MGSIAGRAIIVTKTNKSGGSLAKGDVVIVDSSNDNAVTTTTSAGSTVTVGVVVEENGIANNASGRVQFGGHVGLVNVNASVTRGHYGTTHTVAKQATDGGASRVVGTFCLFTTGGTTPEADLFSQPDASSATGNMATDALWDAAGDLAVGTGANTGAKLTLGAAGTLLRSTGSAAAWAAPSVAFPYGFIRYSSGDITITSTSAGADLPGLGDITIACATGDLIEVGLNARVITPGGGSAAMRMDCATIVSAAAVNYFSSGTGTPATVGIPGWTLPTTGTFVGLGITGSAWYTAQAGDISGGNIVLSIRAWLSGADTWVISGGTNSPLHFFAKNHRQ